MSEISIQVRRVTDRVKQYYKLFGFRSHAVMRPGRSVIRGGRRLGFDEIECVVAETARGTSVGFYPIYALQGLIYSFPFIILLLLFSISSIESVANTITGDEAILGINWLKLFGGNAVLDFKFVLIILLFILLPLITDIIHQRIRLANLKARFSFYTRDAIWDTREAPASLIALRASRSIIIYSWILAILYFAAFSFPSEVIGEVTSLYNISNDELFLASSDAFSLTVGLVIGLLSADKALNMRKENSKIDNRSRITGGMLERRMDPVFYGIQAAAYSSILVGLLMSVTFLRGSSFDFAFQLLIFAMIGGMITGFIHSEGPLWISSTYGILIFFSSLIFIFRTGEQPAYAYIVIIQLFLLPMPFILFMARSFMGVLKREGIESSDWLYDALPLLPIITIYNLKKQKSKAKRRYLDDLDREISPDAIDDRIRIQKELLLNRDSPAHKMAMHYYELLLTYTASFEDDKFIYIPTSEQLLNWWEGKSNQSSNQVQLNFLNFIDRVLWDPNYIPENNQIIEHENVGKNMVLAIQ